MSISPNSLAPNTSRNVHANPEIRAAAEGLEATFLAQMLKISAPEQGAFSGGAGEEQFTSMLVDLRARAMAEAGGIGLADKIYARLSAGVGDR